MESDVGKSELYKSLVDSGFEEQVADEIDTLQTAGLFSDGDPDERAREALKELSSQDVLSVLSELKQTPNIEHVSNKSALLCSIIKTYRQKLRVGSDNFSFKRPGPDETKLKEILDRTGYSLDVTSGQRKYGGPPPNWEGNPPGSGHEIFCGRIPRDIFEDVLIPLFEQCGNIWNLRLMIDPITGYSRGFCFITFTTRDGAQDAVKKYNGHEIAPGKFMKVNISVANVRLFVGNIPKNKSREDILEEFRKHTDGLVDVIIYSSPDDTKKKNRGFSFLEYESHKSASLAKHKIGSGYMRVWGCDIIVDWADPLEEPDEETMSKVKVLYVRNLKSGVTDEQLRAAFEQFGKVERVKKVKDYSFVHFEDREQAMIAMQELQGKKLGDSEMQISLAKPPSENKQKEKRRQQFKHLYGRGAYDDSFLPPVYGGHGLVPIRGVGRPGRPPFTYRGGFRSHMPGYPLEYYGREFRGGSYTDDYFTGYEHEDFMNYSSTFSDARGRALVRGTGSTSHAGPHVPPLRGHFPLWPMYSQQWSARNLTNAPQWSPARR